MKTLKAILVALCRVIIAGAFWLAIRVGTSLTIRHVERETGAPRTYLGMAHKRDIDPFILVPTIVFHRGWKGLADDIRFALRGDGFTRGFLARIIGRPTLMARLLRPLALGTILRWLGTYPTDGLVRPAEEWIREVLQADGNLQATAILTPAFMQDFARLTGLSVAQVGALSLKDLLAWRNYAILKKFYGPEMLLDNKRRHIERLVVARIHGQLKEIVDCLWEGHSILGAPEGQLSPDGTLSPLYAGFWRIVRASPPDLRIVPIAMNYDFMTTRRPHVFVNFAPAIAYAPKLSQAELAVCIHRAWKLYAYFTCTQLASGFLYERRDTDRREFTFHELTASLSHQARKLAAAGRMVDPQLLRPAGVTRKARGYLAYVERRNLVQRLAADRWRINFSELVIKVDLREVAYEEVPLLYAYNELQDLLSVSRDG